MSTLKERMDDIGKEGNIRLGGLIIEVTVHDFKNVYGKDRWLVTPNAGKGSIWVEDIDLSGADYAKE